MVFRLFSELRQTVNTFHCGGQPCRSQKCSKERLEASGFVGRAAWQNRVILPLLGFLVGSHEE